MKSRAHANSSIPRKESAKNAMKDTQSSTANAPRSTRPPPTTSDAHSGKTESAPNAPRDGSSTPRTSAPR